MNKLIREDYMKNTLQWIWDNWNWGKTLGLGLSYDSDECYSIG